MVETIIERKELPQDFRVVFLIGRGSRLPNILDKITVAGSGITVPLVVSHRKLQENGSHVPGIARCRELGITAIYWNLVQMRAADQKIFGEDGEEGYRRNWMRKLGNFIYQEYYRPNLIFMTGWDLVLDENFLNFFEGRIPVLNVHPHPLPDVGQPQDTIVAPDGTTVPVLRGSGTEILVKAVEQKIGWSGVTIHQIIPREYDVGPVVAREWVKIDATDTAETLREKLNEVEDRIVPQTILEIVAGKIKL